MRSAVREGNAQQVTVIIIRVIAASSPTAAKEIRERCCNIIEPQREAKYCAKAAAWHLRRQPCIKKYNARRHGGGMSGGKLLVCRVAVRPVIISRHRRGVAAAAEGERAAWLT